MSVDEFNVKPGEDGGPAFPFKCQGPTTAPEIYYGMSLRDYFAAKFAAAMIGRKEWAVDMASIAENSYMLADAMMTERKSV